MKMTSLKMTKKEAKEQVAGPASSSVDDGPRYPYWTRFSLDNEALEKLGIDFAAMKIGTRVTITAEAVVSDRGENQTLGGDERCHLEFQMETMNVSGSKEARRAAAQYDHLNAIGGGKKA